LLSFYVNFLILTHFKLQEIKKRMFGLSDKTKKYAKIIYESRFVIELKNVLVQHSYNTVLWKCTVATIPDHLIIKTNKMHYFSTLLWYRTLHVSDTLTVHHQVS